MTNEETRVDYDSKAPEVLGGAAEAKSSKPKIKAKVVALSIDENDDFGGDPYNHTGSHAIPEFARED